MRPTFFLTLGTISLVAGACSPSRQPEQQQPPDDAVEMSADSKLTDANVLGIMDAASVGEVEAGKLAAQKATDPDIRTFGQRIADDHARVHEEALALGKALGITPALPPNDKMSESHAKEMAELREKSGREFDEAFLDRQEADHKAVIEQATEDLLPAAQNEEVRIFVHRHLSGLMGHLNAAQALQGKNKSASR